MAGDYFLKIDGIEGESQDERHRGEIVLESWSFGGAQAGAGQEDFSGRTRMRKFNAQPFQFTAKGSKTSSRLFLACTTGQYVKKATLFARKDGANQQDYMTIRLMDILVASYQQSGTSGTDAPTDQVSLTTPRLILNTKNHGLTGRSANLLRRGSM
jgi:type VI secretion system secreted protein Hcp